MSMPYTAPVAHEAVDYYNAPGGRASPVTPSARARTGSSRGRDSTGSFWKGAPPSGRSITRTGAPGDREKGLLDDAGKQLPFLDEVWYTVIPTAQPVWLLFLQGYLDASGVPQEQFDRVITKKLDLSDAFVKKGHIP